MEDIRMLNNVGSQNRVGRQVVNNRPATARQNVATARQRSKSNIIKAGEQLTREQIVARKKFAKFVYRAKVIAVFLAVVLTVATAILIANIVTANRAAAEDENAAIGGVPAVSEIDTVVTPKINAEVIRCSVSCTEGYTRSGEYTHEGVIGGKYEWLGRKCNLYALAEDGSIGDMIGSYEFLDTGYGIDGSMEKGESVTVWVPNMDACWDWLDTYGDYVYMEFVD